MNLNTSTVQRSLDAKLKIGNIEAFDLLIALICGAVMNLFFSGTALEIPLVIGVPVIIIAIFYFGKHGKPEKYLQHFLRYHLEPAFFSAGQESAKVSPMRSRIDA